MDEAGAGAAGVGAGAGAQAGAQGGAQSGAGNNNSGGGTPPGAAGNGAQNGAAGGQSQGSGTAGYRPEGLPDHFAGASDRATIDNLWKAVDGFRRAEGDRGAVPKDITAYAFEANDKLKPYVANFDKDPVWKGVREDALAAGITDKVFAKFMPAVMNRLLEGGQVSAPIDAEKELMQLAPNAEYKTDQERLQAAAQRLNDNVAWLDGAKANKTIPEAVVDYLAARATDEVGAHAVIDWMRGRDVQRGPALGGQGGGGAQSEAALNARLADPKNNPNAVEFDRAFAAETDRLFQQRYGS